MSIQVTPERCHECDAPMYFDIEANVLYCPRACGNEIYLGDES